MFDRCCIGPRFCSAGIAGRLLLPIPPPTGGMPTEWRTTDADTPDIVEGMFNVAFVYVGPIGDGGWTYAHNDGRVYLEENLDNVNTAYLESVPEGADAERVIRSLARKGFDLIYTTSFGYMDPTAIVAEEFPDQAFVRSGLEKNEQLRESLRLHGIGQVPGRHGRRRQGRRGRLQPGRLRRPLPHPGNRPAGQCHDDGHAPHLPRVRDGRALDLQLV